MGTGAHPDGGAQPVLDSPSSLQQVAGHCPRSAESLLRDGHYNGSVSAAVTTAAPTINLLTWVKCPASMLRDGHYNGRVSAAVTTVHMQSFRRGHRLPRVVAVRRPLQWSRLGGRYNGRAYNQSFDVGPVPRVDAAPRPLQWPRLSGRYTVSHMKFHRGSRPPRVVAACLSCRR